MKVQDYKVPKVTTSASSTMPPSAPYVLIATPNLNRANSFRETAAASLGAESVIVRDGEEALQEIARRGPPALAIVDLSLPKVDGFAVLRKLRRDIPETQTRVIVVAAYESLRVAARELSLTLAISSVLPLDVEPVDLADVLSVELRAIRARSQYSAVRALDSPSDGVVDDVVDRAAIEARRRYRLPVSIGYTSVNDEENLTFHVAGRSSGPAVAIGEVSDFTFLRQVAEGDDPLVVPNIEHHPVFASLLLKGPQPVRGFAAVPIRTSQTKVRAAICILDTKPLSLTASDIDALIAYGAEVGNEIEQAIAIGTPATRVPPAASADEVKALQHLAATDPLTGLANRRGGERHIANEVSRAKREQRPLSCILMDIDRFKHVNDTFGHQAGDQILRDISGLLRRNVRAYDILVRWGGEEFLLVLPGVDRDVARVLAERVRLAVEALDTHGIGPITLSAGVARFESDYDFSTTLKTADRRLYQAKASGRNCVV